MNFFFLMLHKYSIAISKYNIEEIIDFITNIDVSDFSDLSNEEIENE